MDNGRNLPTDLILAGAHTRRRFLAFGVGALTSGLLAACGSDDDDDDDGADPTATESGGAQATESDAAVEPTASDGDPTAEDGDAEPTGSDEEPTETAGKDAPAAGDDEPQHGGILWTEMQSDPPNFDLHSNTTSRVYQSMSPCYNLLVQYNQLDVEEIIPDLAESWDISDDGLTATFNLFEGVKFHSGKTMTSADVKASFDRIIFPAEGAISPRKEAFRAVESIDAPEDNVVVFNFSRPMAAFIPVLAITFNAVYNADVLASGDPEREVDGTGPFMFKEYIEGVSIELEKNPNYFVPDRPYLDGIKIFIIPESNSALAAVITDQIHMFRSDFRADAEEARRLAGDRLETFERFSTSCDVLDMNAEREPWNDPRVRKACSLAIDRWAAVELLTSGDGRPAGPLIPDSFWALTPEELEGMPGYARDKEAEREEARALLAEANFPEDYQAVMLVRSGEDYEDTALFVQDQLNTIGISSVLDINETASYTERLNDRDYDIFGGSFSVAIDDPEDIFGQAYVCGGGRNYSQICIEEFDELYVEQSQELDREARKEIVNRMERMVIEDVIKVTLGFAVVRMIQNKRVRGYRLPYSFQLVNKHVETWLAPE